MVFIEERHKYLSQIKEQAKLNAFYSLLWNESFQPHESDLSETDGIYYAIIQSILKGSRKEFVQQYSKISQRKISKDSNAPFLHDDFLIFTLIIGVLKFNADKEWILKVIHARVSNPTTTTFENIINGNFQSKANLQSLVLVFQSILNQSKISNVLLNDAYESLTNIKHSLYDDFIKMIYFKAFDLIILFKIPREADEISRLLVFESTFLKRIKVFAYISYHVLLLLLLIVAYKILHSLPDEVKDNINEIGIIIGIAGIGLFGNIIPKWRTMYQKLVLRVFGYKYKISSHE
ncbi:MAG: hypothetical protein K8R53_00195 [Bacteroidales bacterium]|nr:hypothetical protein [Bacteroidales bacterium]